MKKKFIVSGLLLIMLFCIASVANAAVMRISDYINDYSANVYARSGGTLDISFEVQAPNTMDKIGAKTIILQERVTGSTTWNAVKTYSYTNYSGMLRNRALRHDYVISYYDAVPGNSYRAKVYFYAEKGGSDTIECITGIVKAQ